VTVIDISALNG